MSIDDDPAYKCLRNMIWRIESATPDFSSGEIGLQSYICINDTNVDISTLAARNFEIEYLRNAETLDSHDEYNRRALHNYQVSVYYPSMGIAPNYLYEPICEDQRQLSRLLESDQYYKGYNSSNTSTDVKLFNRLVTSMDVAQETHFWVLNIAVRALLLEESAAR